MFNPRFPGRRIAAASACAALLAVAAPAAVPSASPDSAAPAPFAAPTAAAKKDDAKDPAKSTGKAPAKSSGAATSTSPEKSPSTSADEDPGKDPGKSGEKTPEKSPEKDDAEGSGKDDGKPAKGAGLPEPTTDVGREIRERMDEATETVADRGGQIGMAFLDRKTGELVCNEQCLEGFQLASLSKVFIAEVVGYTNYEPPGRRGEIEAGEGDMPVKGNGDAMLRDDMMRYSDNEATDALWGKYGNTRIVDNVKERYGLSESTVPNPDWGSTKSSAADMVAFFDGMLSKKGGLSDVETRYLVQLMYSLPRYSYGDADQNIGLRAALPDEFVGAKGGWYDPEIRTSAGFFGEDDRYVMAVLTRNVSPSDFTAAIAHVFPEGGAGVEKRGDEAIRQAASAEAESGPVAGAATPWVLALLVAAAAGFGLGWQTRRTAA